MNRPGPPERRAKPCTQADEALHLPECRLDAPWSRRASRSDPSRADRAGVRRRAGAARRSASLGIGAAAASTTLSSASRSATTTRARTSSSRAAILDSLTPGWQQIGAVWLPLPHLLNMLPVQVDALYRTGASGDRDLGASAWRVAAWALARLDRRDAPARASAAVAGAALLVANPNVLYLQSTPMTEPLLFAHGCWRWR